MKKIIPLVLLLYCLVLLEGVFHLLETSAQSYCTVCENATQDPETSLTQACSPDKPCGNPEHHHTHSSHDAHNCQICNSISGYQITYEPVQMSGSCCQNGESITVTPEIINSRELLVIKPIRGPPVI
ncbi:MAG: hypothetical protein HY811_05130 [Planctomycetes bacterium]|nr:hypothetical protein [Planctomycetota bacterium]